MTKEEVYKQITSPDYKFARIQNQDIRMDELVAKARQKQPGLIVVDRAVHGKNQNYLTPENRVPEKALSYPWESCIIAGGSWSWLPDARYMSGKEAVQLLVDIVAKGGNLLLNIAPGPLGQWHDDAYRLLEDIGLWMNVNSEAIYGTRALSPYKEGKICITRKGDKTLYLYYMADEGEEMPAQIGMSAYSLPEKAKIKVLGTETFLKWKKNGKGFIVTIPEKIRRSPASKYVWVMKATF
jgi:alpha-L-fucosidase